MAESEAGVPDGAEYRLGVAPFRAPGRGVTGVADREVARQGGHRSLVEDGHDEAHVLHDGHGLAVGHGHAGRLLSAVLQREQPVECELSYDTPRGMNGEYTAGLFHRRIRLAMPDQSNFDPPRHALPTLPWSIGADLRIGPKCALQQESRLQSEF